MENKQIREILAERKWKIDTSTDKDGLNPDLVLRYLDDVNREDLDALVAYLKSYTSADNEAEDETVTDPMEGTQWHRSGTWNGGQVYFKEFPRDSGPGKVLRLYQELFAGETTIGIFTIENGCKYLVEIYETFFNKTELPTVPVSTSGVSYRIEAFNVDEKRKTYSGYIEKRTRVEQDVAEYVSAVSAAQSVATTEKLGTTDTAALPIAEETGKINRRQVTKNDDCTVDVKKDSVTPKDQTIIEKEESAARSVERETHTEAATALPDPTETPGKINRVVNEETEAGNVKTTAEKVTPKDQTIIEKEESAARTVARETHTEATTPLVDPVETPGEINRVVNEETEAGNVKTTAEKVTPKDQTIEETEESAARSVARTTHTEAETELSPAAEETGKINRVVNEETEAGNVKTTAETVTPKDQTIIEKEESAARSVERETHTEAATALPDPSETPGEINRVVNQETEAGNVKTTAEKVTPKDQTIEETEQSAARSVARTTHTEAETELSPAAEETGKINRVVNEETEAGNVKTTAETVTPKDQTIIEKEESAARSVERETHTEATTPLVDPVETPGEINRVVNQETEAGNVKTTAEKVTPKDQTIEETEESAARSVARTTHTEAETELPPAAEETGKINRVVNEETEAGNVKTTAETVTPKDQTIIEKEESAARSVERETHTEATTPLVDPVETPGEINRVVNQETEAGNVKTTAEKVTPKDQTIEETEESAARSVARTTHTEAETELSPAAVETGKINRVVNEETEAGNVKTTAETVTPKDQTIIEKEESAARSVARETHTEAAAALPDPAETEGEINRVINQETEAGNVKTMAEKVTPKDQTGDSFEKTALETIAETFHSEGEVLPDEVLADGTTVEVVNKPTEAGKSQTVRRVRTGVYVLTDVTYVDRYGDSYFARGLNATEAQFLAAVSAANLTNESNNGVSKDASRYKALVNFTITKQAYDFTNMTTFYGTTGTWTKTVNDIQRRVDSTATVNGYRARTITITLKDYWGISMDAAWNNVDGGDSDSKPPEFKGLIGGIAVYHSRQVTRVYGETWYDGEPT
jgi:hypothetical protein